MSKLALQIEATTPRSRNAGVLFFKDKQPYFRCPPPIYNPNGGLIKGTETSIQVKKF